MTMMIVITIVMLMILINDSVMIVMLMILINDGDGDVYSHGLAAVVVMIPRDCIIIKIIIIILHTINSAYIYQRIT